MKTLIRLFNMLSNRKNDGVNNKKQHQDKMAEYINENGDSTAIRNKYQFQRAQDSIREIILICMEPYM